MKRAALYIRVSHEEQAMHGYSIEAQHEALTDFAQKNNYFIVDYYTDEGLSARKNRVKRKEFVRLLDDVTKDKIDIILFIKLDRWFRSIKDYYDIQSILETHKVAWKAIYEQYDTTTASGRLHVNIMLSVAQDEADRTSERIKFVFEDKVRRGEVISGNMAFGYRIVNKKLQIEPTEAAIVKDIFNYYLHRQSKYAAITYLKEKYNMTLPHHSLSRMLIKPIYIGEYRDVKNFCEPIVDREVFDAVQEVIKSNIKAPKTRFTYVYTGLLRCPACGRNLASAKSKTSENVYNIHYRCNGRYQDKTCIFGRVVGEKKIDAFLLENIEQKMKKCIARYELIAHRSTETVSQVSEIEKVEKKIYKLKDLYLDDLIDKDMYRKEYDALSIKLKELSQKEKETPQRINIAALQQFLQMDIKNIYNTLSREEKQILWRNVIKEIRFDPSTLKPTIFFC